MTKGKDNTCFRFQRFLQPWTLCYYLCIRFIFIQEKTKVRKKQHINVKSPTQPVYLFQYFYYFSIACPFNIIAIPCDMSLLDINCDLVYIIISFSPFPIKMCSIVFYIVLKYFAVFLVSNKTKTTSEYIHSHPHGLFCSSRGS